jgi:small subunit ribosomal protein S17
MAKILKGTVVSDKQDKTVTVSVVRSVQHPIYKKRYSITKKFAAHDEKNTSHVGDVVEISECKPISKRKRWEVSSIVRKAEKA